MCFVVSFLVERKLDHLPRATLGEGERGRGSSTAVSLPPIHTYQAMLISSSFLIGRKGLREDLKRFEEAGDARLQRLVTEYRLHEVCLSVHQFRRID
jgi:hypothetical protein